ncbi:MULTISPECIES: Rv0518 family GDSL lipase [unclassified Mycobacterium]|uniref:Rv0518 family GDSL lipase n=1 Tax=unclassified Mycobacterium TaxID=2642494 RepID=UPI000F9316BE|nr:MULTISPECIES: GDSL lipase [unclassified Mycobacterium]MDP7704051.1 SGNH/GDSL hydrolase family protein [Mycobacterium sp. TY815]MDP7722534.1 SGNH/GDSL hydrolase family protein [Mycobacterium sp. TY814]RUP02098.1 MAG: SGNH/GDSL hydrolase family protein [Mycobacterium sp.]
MTRLATFAIRLGVLVALALPCLFQPVQDRPYRTLTLDLRLKPVAVIGDSYTTGTDEGGIGPKSWTARTWRTLTAPGLRIASDVAAEGRAGYGTIGDHGSIFQDLTARAVKPEDVLVVFFGSRNDQDVDPVLLAQRVHATFALARRRAPAARFLVVGPPWPTADVPVPVLVIRDVLAGAAWAAGADFVDPIGDRWFVDRPDLIGADGVHPNDAGHEYMAEKMAPLIRWQLSR